MLKRAASTSWTVSHFQLLNARIVTAAVSVLQPNACGLSVYALAQSGS